MSKSIVFVQAFPHHFFVVFLLRTRICRYLPQFIHMMSSMWEERAVNTGICIHSGFFVVQTKNLKTTSHMDRPIEEEIRAFHNHLKILQSQQESPFSQLSYDDYNPNAVCTFHAHSESNQCCDY